MKCNECGSEQATRAGRILNRKGVWQKYLCKKCGHTYKGELLEEFPQT